MSFSARIKPRRVLLLSLATCVLLSGCGGSGSSDSGGGSPGTLTLTSSTPANGATGVARSVAPQLVFSSALNPAAATATNVTLTYAAGAAAPGFAVAGTQLTMTPSRSLLPLTTYTVRAGTGLTGIAGETLTAAQTVRFTTADGAWRTARLIETDNTGSAQVSQIAFDGSGNALAVWSQSDGTRNNIWSNRYTAGTGWGSAQLIETDNAGTATAPHIAIDGSGNALAVWQQSDGTRTNIWSNRYMAGTGWGTAQLIETNNAGGAQSPQIAVDTNGNGLAVWHQNDGTRDNIWSNRYTAGTGWGTAQLIETDNAGDATAPHVAIDTSGNGLAVWAQFDGTRANIWSNRYTFGTGWGTAQLIETDNAGDATAPHVALDRNGNALAVWFQFDGIRDNIWSNRYTAGTGWGTAQLIEIDNLGGCQSPQIAMDASGNALAVWSEFDGVRDNIWSNRYTAGIGWGTAQMIETDNSGTALSPQIGIDASGNGLAVWYQNDGVRDNIWSNRFTPGVGWGAAQLIETDNTGSAQFPQVAVDGSGNALAVWQQSDGARTNIWSNRFD